MTVFLDGREMTGRAAAHDHLAAQLNFPAWYGRNLDALYDLLCELPASLLVLEHSETLLAALGDYGTALLNTLKDAAANNPRLELKIQ